MKCATKLGICMCFNVGYDTKLNEEVEVNKFHVMQVDNIT
jgi:hypothetical protein